MRNILPFWKYFSDIWGLMAKTGKILRPEIDEKTMGINPFVSSLVVKVFASRSGYVPDEEDGGMLVDNWVQLEVDTFAKMFDGADNRLVMAGLSFRALQVWNWVLFTLEPGKDYVWINQDRLMNECRVKSVKTFRAAVMELIRYGHLAVCAGLKNVYWINPSIGFKGSRVKKFPANVVKRGGD